ncbi:Gfo/Idh/MocA family protein [Aliagarivorans marinus]|uniref:Gfo/Idh/MocA family protein n=1 Tax=Aliagarivorans marinus TaxID=561965 RepID=UPI000404BCDE|nr:Gfo/Idh/MocA family oxidoreductase [Aliagarivorans marinus]
MSHTLRWGILGTSFISGVMAEAIQLDGSSELYAIAGRSPEPRQAMAKQYGIPVQHDDYQALIDDPQVDIVYIALPNHVHHDYVVKAAQAGKAILCEKSLSVDMPKTELALAAVEQHQVFFAEGLMYLNHPLIATLCELVNSGEIGTLRAISAQYTAAISQFVNPGSKGALFNLGCYPASLVHLLLQQSGNLSDYQLQATGRRGADGNICDSAATIQFANGITAQLHTAEDYGLHASFSVLGDKGSIELLNNPWLPSKENRLRVRHYEQPAREICVDAEGDGFLYQVRAILAALRAGNKQLARPAAGWEDSRQIMQLLSDWHSAAELAG